MATLKIKISFAILAAVCASLSISGHAQTPSPGPKVTPVVPAPPSRGQWPLNRRFARDDGDTTEKSITVVDNVNFSMCVRQGTLQINGWKRNEVRVFVKDGSRISIIVPEKDTKSQNPAWVKVVGLES